MHAHNHRLKFTSGRLVLFAAVAAVLALAAIIIYVIQVNRRIAGERERQASATRVEVEERSLRSPSTDGLTLYLNASEVRGVATFAGIRYLATSGGLIELDEAGNVKRRFTTFDGLPENDLTAIAVFRDRLFAGTSSAGLIAFDGQSFSGYRFAKPKATHVSVLVPTESELLIGTLDGGLFEYDGERFSRRFNSTTGADFNRVTALLPFESRLYVGTQDNGLYIWREAHIEHITTNERLPSPHVTGLTVLPSGFRDIGAVGVATDFGVVGVDDANGIKLISNHPNATSLAVSGGHLWAGLFGGGITDLSGNKAAHQDASPDTRMNRLETVGLPESAPATV
ncbi:MAG TPA: hypothetical protein VLR92_00550, partial [Blastocatellia bacterium]|nr:hypothetical protein [Blastocatellia bacterium]